MKKLMLVAAMLALALAIAVPAMAQLASGVGQSPESDDVALSYGVENSGNYASQCTPAIQFGNTGNFDNGSSFVQYDGKLDDFEPGGIEVAVEPTSDVACDRTVQQSSAASS
jgi:hypothetical protein